jgi:hypothetical protein
VALDSIQHGGSDGDKVPLMIPCDAFLETTRRNGLRGVILRLESILSLCIPLYEQELERSQSKKQCHAALGTG